MNKQPQIWTRLLGENADVNKIADNVPDDSGNVSFAKLFGKITAVPLEKGGIAPEREDFNALFKLLGEVAYYFMHGGIYNYANNIDYEVGSFVRYNNELYVCVTANGPATTIKVPTDLSYWANVKNAVKLATARTINIQDASGANTGTGIDFDGTKNAIIKLPQTIKGTFDGIALSAQKLATARKLTLKDGNGYTNVSVVVDGSKDIEITVPLGFATPVGTVMMIAGSSIPSGFLLCNGAAISRTTYAKLFAAIGTMYGAGDGATTFNLPDMRDRFAEGAGGTYSVGTVVEAGLPNITGQFLPQIVNIEYEDNKRPADGRYFEGFYTYTGFPNGAFQSLLTAPIALNKDTATHRSRTQLRDYACGVKMNANLASNIYKSTSVVQPKSLVFNYIVKY
nr:MAG TPA: tail collar fiber protein [Caudoviricetes sp.]